MENKLQTTSHVKEYRNTYYHGLRKERQKKDALRRHHEKKIPLPDPMDSYRNIHEMCKRKTDLAK